MPPPLQEDQRLPAASFGASQLLPSPAPPFLWEDLGAPADDAGAQTPPPPAPAPPQEQRLPAGGSITQPLPPPTPPVLQEDQQTPAAGTGSQQLLAPMPPPLPQEGLWPPAAGFRAPPAPLFPQEDQLVPTQMPPPPWQEDLRVPGSGAGAHPPPPAPPPPQEDAHAPAAAAGVQPPPPPPPAPLVTQEDSTAGAAAAQEPAAASEAASAASDATQEEVHGQLVDKRARAVQAWRVAVEPSDIDNRGYLELELGGYVHVLYEGTAEDEVGWSYGLDGDGNKGWFPTSYVHQLPDEAG